MEFQLTYRQDVFEKFDIFHNEKNYPDIKKYTFSKKKLDKLFKSNCFEEYDNSTNAYKYYLYRDLKHVTKWYRSDLFQILHPCGEYSYKPESHILIVKNNETGRIDNIISKKHFDDINERIQRNSKVYITSKHSCQRSQFRIPELSELINQWYVDNWLCDHVNFETYSCVLKSQFKAINLLDHNFEVCDYYMDNQGRVFVTKNHILLTVHCNEAERYKRN